MSIHCQDDLDHRDEQSQQGPAAQQRVSMELHRGQLLSVASLLEEKERKYLFAVVVVLMSHLLRRRRRRRC